MTIKHTALIVTCIVLFTIVFVILEVSNISQKPIPEVVTIYPSANDFDESRTSDNLLGIGGGYYYLGEGIGKILCTSEITCLHEVGHHKDSLLENPSASTQWITEVDHFILMCLASVEHFFCTIKDFPGIYGNPMQDLVLNTGDIMKWGGYSELYAHIYEYSISQGEDKPTSFEVFYTNNWKEGE